MVTDVNLKKISNAKLVRNKIENIMGVDSVMKITYNEQNFKITSFKYSNKKTYTISEDTLFGRSMNVSKITDKYISLYTFDMMGNQSTYKMALDKIIPGEIITE